MVVIGSGPAGAMAAHELVRLGCPVTLLESGTEPPRGVLLRAMGRNLFRRVPPMQDVSLANVSGDPRTEWHVHLQPGGLTNQWTGAVPRFAPEDFTEGARLHPRYQWPVTYDDLSPYYERAERLMHVTAGRSEVPLLPLGHADWRIDLPADWLKVAEVAKRVFGQGLAPMPLADGPPWLMVRRGTAFNSFSTIVRPLLSRPNFRLVQGAHALRIELAQGSPRAESVIYFDRAKRVERRVRADAVVVACGPLNSTRLLFQSACARFPEGLGNSRGLLGRFLHDHPREWWVMDLKRPLSLLAPSGYLTRLPHARSEPLVATSWTIGVVSTFDRVRSRFGAKGSAVGVQVFGTMIPEERYYVRPAESGYDELGQPLLDIHIRFEEYALENMVRARSHFVALLEEAGYSGSLRDVVPQLHPGTSVHYGGTARMHASPEYGVTDAWNRLYDAANVVVCDASCFTTGCEKNPTLTAMALASRAAERLMYDLKAG